MAADWMFTSALPKVYENWWRPTWARMLKGVFGPGMADEHRIARLLLALKPGDGVLDVACGPGNFSRDFARVVGDAGLVVGIDASQPMLERAVRLSEGVGFGRQPLKRTDYQAMDCVGPKDYEDHRAAQPQRQKRFESLPQVAP